MSSIENLFKKTFAEREKNTTVAKQSKDLPIKNNKEILKNEYELYSFDDKFKDKNYYKQYHTTLNHFFSRLKYDLDLSEEQMQELAHIVADNVEDIQYIDFKNEDENKALISGTYEEKRKAILLNASKVKERTDFNLTTELYRQLLDVISTTKLKVINSSSFNLDGTDNLYLKICNEYIANRISNNSMQKDGKINTQNFSRCAAIVPFIANFLGIDEKDYLKNIVVNPNEDALFEGDYFIKTTGGNEIYDENGVEQYQSLSYTPNNFNVSTIDIFKLQLHDIAPYYIDFSDYSSYSALLKNLNFLYSYNEEKNPYFKECRENLEIYMAELLGKTYLEEALSDQENIQYLPQMKKWEGRRNGGFSFDLVKSKSIEMAEQQISSIPRYTDKLLEKLGLVIAEEQKTNSREHIGKWDNRALEEEMKKATWITKVNINEESVKNIIDMTSLSNEKSAEDYSEDYSIE